MTNLEKLRAGIDHEDWPATESLMRQAADEIEGLRKSCISRIGESQGFPFVVYLRDGSKITVGRDKRTKGPAWLVVEKQLEIKAT